MSSVGIAIYVAIAAATVSGFLLGMRRGLYKSLIDLGVAVVSVVLSAVVAKWLSKSLVDDQMLLQYLDLLVEKIPSMADTVLPFKESLIGLANDSDAIGMAMAFPVVLLTPIIFMLVYLIIATVMKLPKLLITRTIFGKNSGETYHGGSRIFGSVFGTATKLVSLAVTLIPVIGYIVLVSNTMLAIGDASIKDVPTSTETVQVMSSTEGETEDTTEAMEATFVSLGQNILQLRNEYILPLIDNPVVSSINTCGGAWFFGLLTSTRVGEETVSLTGEFEVISNLYEEAVVLLKVPTAEYGEAQTTAIDNITSILGEEKVIPTVLSGVLSHCSQAWLNGETAFGMEKANVGEYYEPTLDKILTMCAQTSRETIKEDLETLGDIVNVCIEEGAFVDIANGTPINIPKNEELMGQIFVELYENNRTRPLAGDLINSFKNYIYKVYNDVNNTEVPYPPQLDINLLTKEDVYEEGRLMASILDDFTKFYATVDMNEEDNTKFLIQADVRSLGKALDKIERSIIFGDAYSFILPAILKSEGAAQFAFMTPDFAEAMINRKSSMENVLVSRQQIGIILYATQGEHRDEAIKYIVENIDVESAEVIKETLTSDVLKQFNMNDSQSQSMSNTLNSIVDQIAENENNYSDEQLDKEMEAIGMIVNTVKGATTDDEDIQGENLFAAEEGDYSKSDITAEKFVETVVQSEIVTSAIINSSKDEEGNAVEDPYKISTGMSSEDKENVAGAIENYYQNNKTDSEADEQLKEKLNSIANVLGLQANLG